MHRRHSRETMEQKQAYEAMRCEIRGMFADGEAMMTKFISTAPISPIQAAEYDPSLSNIPMMPPVSRKPPDPPDFNRSKLKGKLSRMYSCEEIHERMVNGLCIFCEELDVPGHNLKHKRSQIFMMECNDDRFLDDKEVEELVVKGIVANDIKKEMKSSDIIYAAKGAETTSASFLPNGVVTPRSKFGIEVEAAETSLSIQVIKSNCAKYTIGTVMIQGKEPSPEKYNNHYEMLELTPKLHVRGLQRNKKTLSPQNEVWEPGGVLVEHDKRKWAENYYKRSRVMRLMQEMSITWWSYGKVLESTQELQQQKTYLQGIKLRELDMVTKINKPGEKHRPPEEDAGEKTIAWLDKLRNSSGLLPTSSNRLKMQRIMQNKVTVFHTKEILEEEFMGLIESSGLQLAREFLLLNYEIFVNPKLLHEERTSLLAVLKVARALLVVFEHNKAIMTHNEQAEKLDKHKYNFLETIAEFIISGMIGGHKDRETACALLGMNLNGDTHMFSYIVKDYGDGLKGQAFTRFSEYWGSKPNIKWKEKHLGMDWCILFIWESKEDTYAKGISKSCDKRSFPEQLERVVREIRLSKSSFGRAENCFVEFRAHEVFHLQRPPEKYIIGYCKMLETISSLIHLVELSKTMIYFIKQRITSVENLVLTLKRLCARLIGALTLKYKRAKLVEITMDQFEKSLVTIISYEMLHSPRPPELSCCKKDEELSSIGLVSTGQPSKKMKPCNTAPRVTMKEEVKGETSLGSLTKNHHNMWRHLIGSETFAYNGVLILILTIYTREMVIKWMRHIIFKVCEEVDSVIKETVHAQMIFTESLVLIKGNNVFKS